jgi:hypothetical protein
VRYTEDRPQDHHWWTVSLSHECIEMVIDPDMHQTIQGPAPDGGDEPVDYLLEICDPCQSGTYAYPYSVDGRDDPIWLSDFVLPEYFQKGSQSSRFSFNGSVTRPFQILPHGCLTWGDPRTKGLWQQWGREDGTVTEAKRVRAWQPAAPGDRSRLPPQDGGKVQRESLYDANPDYRLARIPGADRVAQARASIGGVRSV